MKHTERDPLPDTPRNIRLDAGLKLRQVAELMDAPISSVGRIERGRVNPTAASLGKFYAACGRADLMRLFWPVVGDRHRADMTMISVRYQKRFGPDSPHGLARAGKG
jgi:transcriptional regulator with XRE-family HTH domain